MSGHAIGFSFKEVGSEPPSDHVTCHFCHSSRPHRLNTLVPALCSSNIAPVFDTARFSNLDYRIGAVSPEHASHAQIQQNDIL